MDILEFRDFCLSLPLTEETAPFNDDTLVYKIGGKMYAYASMNDFTWIGVKCDPSEAADYRERYLEITPASHMNRMHWIRLGFNGSLTDDFIRERIRNSYRLVVNAMGRSKRNEILSAIEESGENTEWIADRVTSVS